MTIRRQTRDLWKCSNAFFFQNGDTALHIVVQERLPEAVRILLGRNAETGCRNKVMASHSIYFAQFYV